MIARIRKASLVTFIASSVALAGCETSSGPSGADIGTALGVIGGAVIGSQFGTGTGKVAATAAGAVIGGWIGREIGRRLTQQDYAYMNNASYNAAMTGRHQNWNNPNTGVYGTVQPTGTYYQSGRKCTTLNQSVTASGQTSHGQMVACQMPDGTIQLRPI